MLLLHTFLHISVLILQTSQDNHSLDNQDTFSTSNDYSVNSDSNEGGPTSNIYDYPTKTEESEATSIDEINVQFTVEEANFVVGVLNEREKEISQIKKKILKSASYIDNDISLAPGSQNRLRLNVPGIGLTTNYSDTDNLAENRMGKGKSKGIVEGEGADDYNSVNNMQAAPRCLCGEGSPPDSLAMERRFQENTARLRKMARRNRVAREPGTDYADDNNDETSRDEEDRIVNGYRADSRPWFAGFGSRRGAEISTSCGGALINHRFIL